MGLHRPSTGPARGPWGLPPAALSSLSAPSCHPPLGSRSSYTLPRLRESQPLSHAQAFTQGPVLAGSAATSSGPKSCSILPIGLMPEPQ